MITGGWTSSQAQLWQLYPFQILVLSCLPFRGQGSPRVKTPSEAKVDPKVRLNTRRNPRLTLITGAISPRNLNLLPHSVCWAKDLPVLPDQLPFAVDPQNWWRHSVAEATRRFCHICTYYHTTSNDGTFQEKYPLKGIWWNRLNQPPPPLHKVGNQRCEKH